MTKRKNNLQHGSTRVIVFKESNEWYAVALELNIVESGTNPREAILLLFEAVSGYIEAAQKTKASFSILNQESDEEYEKLWKKLQEHKKLKNKEVFFFGEHNLVEDKNFASA